MGCTGDDEVRFGAYRGAGAECRGRCERGDAARGGRRAGTWIGRALAVPLALVWVAPAGAAPEKPAPGQDSCASCHSNPELLVTNKHLYDYYQQWSGSVHEQEGVTCDDCHGGDPRARDMATAHGRGVGSSEPGSSIYYTAVPNTCGQCHDEILDGFRKSNHYRHLVKKKQELQGPTCVTCHGSMNTDILDVRSVKDSCARCHNEKLANHPEIPEKALYLINRFLSIHRLYRYIATNAQPEESQVFFKDIDAQLRKLSVTWHTFDIGSVETQTGAVLAVLKAKRDELRERRRGQGADEAMPGEAKAPAGARRD